MTKALLFPLIMLLLLSHTLAVSVEAEYTCYAATYGTPFDFEKGIPHGLTEEEASRVVRMRLFPFFPNVLVLLPEDCGITIEGQGFLAEPAYGDRFFESAPPSQYIGLRLTFSKPFVKVALNGQLAAKEQLREGDLLRPVKVEIAGTVSYGPIVGRTPDAIEQQVVFDSGHSLEVRMTDVFARYTLTADTERWVEIENLTWDVFVPGQGCEMIIDADGNVLAIRGANG